jgi:mannose-6-phosphate isomerase-like protein (cupin superfamily)
MSRTGQALVDVPDATILVLADRPELVMTYARLRPEGGPPLHVHREHADGFALLGGDLAVFAGVHRGRLGEDMVWVAPPHAPHTYRHEGTSEVRFLNFHAPGMGFADYLFGERPPHEADQFEPSDEDHGKDAIVHRIDGGETVTDSPERTIRILADLPELALTSMRFAAGEQGPPPHIHQEHVDAFFLLDGELVFQVGREERNLTVGANTFVLVPPHVVHTFHAGPTGARWINLHAPSTGFPDFLRDPASSWDTLAPPEDGGRPADEVIVQHIHPA